MTDSASRTPDVDETRSDATGEIKVVSAPPATTLTGQHQAVNANVAVAAAGRSSLSRWSAVLLVVAALIGFVVVGQVREPEDLQSQLNEESEGDLARILSSLSSESNSLQTELAQLKVDLANLQNSTQADGTAAAETDERLNALRVLAGTVPVTGPGLEMRIDDPQRQVRYSHLVDGVQELRDAGAEALTINGRRIGVASSFGVDEANRLTMDGRPLEAPYVLAAIGPATTMEGGVKIPGGALDTLGALGGVEVTLVRSNSLSMPALEEPLTFRAARPIGSQP